MVALLTLTTSGCADKVILKCPEFEPKTKSPILDMNGTGSMQRLSLTEWRVTHKQVLKVKEFEKACYQRDADFISTTKAINAFNDSVE